MLPVMYSHSGARSSTTGPPTPIYWLLLYQKILSTHSPSLLNDPEPSFQDTCIYPSQPAICKHLTLPPPPANHMTGSHHAPASAPRTVVPAPAPAQPKRESDSSFAYEQAEIERVEALKKDASAAPKGVLGSGEKLKPREDNAGLGRDDEYVFV